MIEQNSTAISPNTRNTDCEHSTNYPNRLNETLIDTTNPDEAADRLLELSGFLGKDCYTETQLNRKIRNENKRLPDIDSGLSQKSTDFIIKQAIDDLVEAARLSPIQEICFRLYSGGLSRRTITHSLGLSRHRVTLHLKVARRKVRKAYSEGKYAGWYEVYLSEVNRPAYRKR